jgi:hypothetical protein
MRGPKASVFHSSFAKRNTRFAYFRIQVRKWHGKFRNVSEIAHVWLNQDWSDRRDE